MIKAFRSSSSCSAIRVRLGVVVSSSTHHRIAVLGHADMAACQHCRDRFLLIETQGTLHPNWMDFRPSLLEEYNSKLPVTRH